MSFKFSDEANAAFENFDSETLYKCGLDSKNESKYEDALQYFLLAATMGNLEATYEIGTLYLDGLVEESNADLGLKYITLAAARGDIQALYRLGLCNFRGEHLDQNTEAAIFFFEEAMRYVHDRDQKYYEYPDLCYFLGGQKYFGTDMPKDIYGAKILLEFAKIGYKNFQESNSNRAKEFIPFIERIDSLLKMSDFDEFNEIIEFDDFETYIYTRKEQLPVCRRTKIGLAIKVLELTDDVPTDILGFVDYEYKDGTVGAYFDVSEDRTAYLELDETQYKVIKMIKLSTEPGTSLIEESDFITGIPFTGIKRIDENEELATLNKNLNQLILEAEKYKKLNQDLPDDLSFNIKNNFIQFLKILKSLEYGEYYINDEVSIYYLDNEDYALIDADDDIYMA